MAPYFYNSILDDFILPSNNFLAILQYDQNICYKMQVPNFNRNQEKQAAPEIGRQYFENH